MYYYIIEPPRSKEEQRAQEAARTLLTSLGIAGEFVSTSPARSIEELAEIGVAKKYTTIVAMGSDLLLNRVATLLAGTPYVFGAIPIEHARSLELTTGITSIQEAVEALKYRRVHLVSVSRIEPNKFFLTDLVINQNLPFSLRLTLDGAQVETEANEVRITGTGRVLLRHTQEPTGTLVKLKQLFGTTVPAVHTRSQFNGQRILLETTPPLAAYLGRELLARTPLAITVIPYSLKIITRRDRVSPSQT